jgi:Holliday junction resolvase RusA-like endonuclease
MIQESITLDLPTPPSVNRTRRINWAASRQVADWKADADKLVLSQRVRRPDPAIDRYELHITLAENCRIDGDNICKSAIDYLKRIEFVADDGPQHMRRLVVEFGEAPHGCRVEVRPI